MADPFTLAIAAAGTAVAVKKAVSTIKQARAAAQAQYEANAKTVQNAAKDEIRQIREINVSSQEAVSDRVRTANQEIAMASVMAAERGSSQSTMLGLIRQISFAEGTDLSRIEKGRVSAVNAARQETGNVIDAATYSNQSSYNTAVSQSKAAKYDFISSGLQIASDATGAGATQKAATNKTASIK